MSKKAYKPIRVDCTKGQEHSSIRFPDAKAAESWVSVAKSINLIDSAYIILDLAGAYPPPACRCPASDSVRCCF